VYTTKPLPVLVTERARATPDAVAIESIATAEQISWSQLDGNCRRWADALRRLNVERGEYVVTLMPNTPDAIYAWLGCAWLRAVEVPVNTDYRGEWLTHAINTSHARVLVVSRRFTSFLALAADTLTHVKIVVIYDGEPEDDDLRLGERFHVIKGAEFLAGTEPAYDLTPPEMSDTAAVIYTSGTTGQAKAVQNPWGVFESQRLLFAPPEFRDSVFYGFWPPFHSLGKSQLFVPAAFGGKLVLRERFSMTDFWSDIRKYECTTAYLVSVIAAFVYGQPRLDDDGDNPLKAVIMGPLIPEIDDFKRRFGVNVYTTFGSTEVGSVFFSFMREVTGNNWRSVGRVAEESPTEIAVVDQNDLPVGRGEPGELIVRPKPDMPWTLTMGYLNMPEATVRAWRNGWYHTGDAFVVDEDGEYYFVDRAKDYIRRRGENISSFEVEQAVGGFPGVAQVAAVPVPSEVAEDEVMVFIVAEPGQPVDPAELIDFLQDRVPKFALPRFVEIVDSLPLTQATFRVQKSKLRDQGPGPNTFDRLKQGV
jgi:crotonobetaine/carnitine-CoA ligase